MTVNVDAEGLQVSEKFVSSVENNLDANKRKALFGHNSSGMDKLYIFAFYAASLGLFFVLALFFKKSKFHSLIFSKFGANKLDETIVKNCEKKLKASIPEGEVPLFAVLSRGSCLMFTDQNIIWNLKASKKIFDTKTTAGSMPLKNLKDIKLAQNFIDDVAVMLNDDVIGAVESFNSKDRLDLFLKSIARGIREEV
jgi:hypothetical protein